MTPFKVIVLLHFESRFGHIHAVQPILVKQRCVTDDVGFLFYYASDDASTGKQIGIAFRNVYGDAEFT